MLNHSSARKNIRHPNTRHTHTSSSHSKQSHCAYHSSVGQARPIMSSEAPSEISLEDGTSAPKILRSNQEQTSSNTRRRFVRNTSVALCIAAVLLVGIAVVRNSPSSSVAASSSRRSGSENCNAPNSIDTSILEAVNRSRRLGLGRPSCDQVANASNTQRVVEIIGGEEGWEFLFPLRHQSGQEQGAEPFTYHNFLTAVTQWPEFCGDNVGPYFANLTAEDACKRELATLFANFAQELGAQIPDNGIPEWRQALYFLTEKNCENGAALCQYGICSDWQGEAYPCVAGKSYFGRGAYQLSWNYNYGPFSKAMFGDVNVLLADPDLMIDEGWLAFASAIWFHMTPQSPKPSGHDVVYGHFSPNQADIDAGRLPGFGAQIMIINGGLECGSTALPDNAVKADNREEYYLEFANHFGVAPGSDFDCKTMQSFDETSAAAVTVFWDKDQNTDCECKIVEWSTPDSFFAYPDDPDQAYCRCLARHYEAEECPAATAADAEWDGGAGGDECPFLPGDVVEAPEEEEEGDEEEEEGDDDEEGVDQEEEDEEGDQEETGGEEQLLEEVEVASDGDEQGPEEVEVASDGEEEEIEEEEEDPTPSGPAPNLESPKPGSEDEDETSGAGAVAAGSQGVMACGAVALLLLAQMHYRM